MAELKQLLYLPYMAYRQARWLLGDRSPLGATCKLTTRCTLHCRHCPWTKHSLPDLSTERWLGLIDEVRRWGARHLVLEGGEPTLREDLPEIIGHARKRGMRTTLATSATLNLSAYMPDRFLVSVDGLPENHDRLRGEGAFQQMMTHIATAGAEKIALVSLSRLNVNDAEPLMDRLRKVFDGFWFSFVYDYPGREALALPVQQKRQAAARLLELSRDYSIINKPSYLRRVGISRPCRDWLLVTITADGIIHRGCMVSVFGSCECESCELACYREFSDLIDPALYFFHLRDFFGGIRR